MQLWPATIASPLPHEAYAHGVSNYRMLSQHKTTSVAEERRTQTRLVNTGVSVRLFFVGDGLPASVSFSSGNEGTKIQKTGGLLCA